jgi:spermidine synthase
MRVFLFRVSDNQILFACKGDLLKISAEELLRRSAQLSKSHEIHLPRTAQNFLLQRNLTHSECDR